MQFRFSRPGVRQVPEGSGEQGKMEKTGRKIICGAPTTLAVKGLMMMMSSDSGQFRNWLFTQTGKQTLTVIAQNAQSQITIKITQTRGHGPKLLKSLSPDPN